MRRPFWKRHTWLPGAGIRRGRGRGAAKHYIIGLTPLRRGLWETRREELVRIHVNKLNWPGGEGESGAGGGRQGTEGRWARGERGGGLEGPAGGAGTGAHYKL